MAAAAAGSASSPVSRGQRRHVSAGHDVARFAAQDGVRRAAGIAADDRQARRGCLQVDDPQSLYIQAVPPGAAGHREHVARVVVAGQFRPGDRAGEYHGAGYAEPAGQAPELGPVGPVPDQQQHRAASRSAGPPPGRGQDLRPRAEQGVLALARHHPGNADDHRAAGQPVPLPDGGSAGAGPERGRVHPRRQPHHPPGGLRGQRAGQPHPEVLAEIGDHIDLVADPAQ